MVKLVVILVIFAFSALSNWLQKRRQAEQAGEAARNPQPPPGSQVPQNRPLNLPRPIKPTSWEEELRRLLEGETPSAPPTRPQPAPPPTVVTPTPRTITLPPLRPVVQTARLAPAPPPIRPAIVRLPDLSPTPVPVPTVTSLSTRDLATMTQSRQAYQKASELDQQVAAHIAKIPGQHVQSTSVSRVKISPELAQTVAMFRNARTARQAVVASLILGPPRALEQEGSGF